jgi:hypothetical protein
MEICYRLAAGIPFINQEAKKMSKKAYKADDKKLKTGERFSRSAGGLLGVVDRAGRQIQLEAAAARSLYQFIGSTGEYKD